METRERVHTSASTQLGTEGRRLLELIPDHCYLVRDDLEIADANETALQDLHLVSERVLGRKLHAVMHRQTDTREEISCTELLRTMCNEDVCFHLCLDECTRVFSFRGSPIPSADSKPTELFLLIGRDVSSLAQRATQNEYRALHDPLTGALNRWFLEELLHRESARAKRSDLPVQLFMLDIDAFKSINDEYGHAAGDEALRWVATCLMGSVRETDYVLRYGGDEFLVILPECPKASSYMEDRLRASLAKTEEDDSSPYLPVSVSIGSACWYPDQKLCLEDAVARADRAMFKGRGRRLKI